MQLCTANEILILLFVIFALIFVTNQKNIMKHLILVLAFIFSGIFAQAQTKVGTIDAEYILAQLPEITEVEQGLKEYNEELQEDVQNSIKEYEALIEEYQANNETFTEEEKQEKESEIVSLENEIKNFRQKASVLMQMRRNELTEPLYEKINEAMQAVISEQNFTQVLNSSANGLAYADPDYDITDAVLVKLGISVE